MKEAPIYMVFVFYLIISSNFLAQLFPCRLQHLLNNSMIAKHFAGYMTLLFFVVLSSGDTQSASTALLYSLWIYLLFWVSTRVAFEYLIVFLILAAYLYIVHLYQKETGGETSKRLEIIRDVVHWFMLIVIVAGLVFYWLEKKMEYKKNFSTLTFLLGKPVCRNKSPTLRFFKKKKTTMKK